MPRGADEVDWQIPERVVHVSATGQKLGISANPRVSQLNIPNIMSGDQEIQSLRYFQACDLGGYLTPRVSGVVNSPLSSPRSQVVKLFWRPGANAGSIDHHRIGETAVGKGRPGRRCQDTSVADGLLSFQNSLDVNPAQEAAEVCRHRESGHPEQFHRNSVSR